MFRSSVVFFFLWPYFLARILWRIWIRFLKTCFRESSCVTASCVHEFTLPPIPYYVRIRMRAGHSSFIDGTVFEILLHSFGTFSNTAQGTRSSKPKFYHVFPRRSFLLSCLLPWEESIAKLLLRDPSCQLTILNVTAVCFERIECFQISLV